MKIVLYPAVEADRLGKIREANSAGQVLNASEPDEAKRAIADADAFFGKITPELLAAAKRLCWIQAPTASLEHYVFPALIEHPCTLTNMRGIYSDVIATHVFAYILCFARNLHRYVRNQLEARWSPAGGEEARSTFTAGPGVCSAMDRAHGHIAGQTIGVIGLGGIGREVARIAHALQMRVVAIDPKADQAMEGVEAIWRPEDLPRLLAESHYVVIAAPHTPATAKLFRSPQFEQMKPGAYLINIGRGVIVDLADLTRALEERKLAGAALDVFETEPLPADHPLWQMENVLITPHVAGNSPRIAERHLEVVLENIRRFASGRPLLNVVDKSQWF